MHAADMEDVLPGEEDFVGGRAESAEEFLKQLEDAQHRKRWGAAGKMPTLSFFMKVVVLWTVVMVLAVCCWFRFAMVPPFDQNSLSSGPLSILTKKVAFNLAVAFSLIALLIVLYEFVVLSAKGQAIVEAVQHFFKAIYIGFLMVVVSLLYIPITTQALSVFFCTSTECPLGSWFLLESPQKNYLDTVKDTLTKRFGEGDSSSGNCQVCEFLSGPGTPPELEGTSGMDHSGMDHSMDHTSYNDGDHSMNHTNDHTMDHTVDHTTDHTSNHTGDPTGDHSMHMGMDMGVDTTAAPTAAPIAAGMDHSMHMGMDMGDSAAAAAPSAAPTAMPTAMHMHMGMAMAGMEMGRRLSVHQAHQDMGLSMGTDMGIGLASNHSHHGMNDMGVCTQQMLDTLCPATTVYHHFEETSLNCKQEEWFYLVPGSFLTLVCFTLMVPYMYYTLTKQHTRRYKSLQVFEMDSPMDGAVHGRFSVALAARASFLPAGLAKQAAATHLTSAEKQEEWAIRVGKSVRNKAKALYYDFRYKWRYWKLVMLGQKFCLATMFSVAKALDLHLEAISVVLLIHSVMLALSLYARPYTDKRPDCLAISISIANVANSCFLILAFLQVAVPQWMWVCILVINVVVPILSLFLGWYLNIRHAKQQAVNERESGVGRRRYVPPLKLAQRRRVVERNINEFTLRFLVFWTSIVVFCSCISYELLVIGEFHKTVAQPIQGHTVKADVPRHLPECQKQEYWATLEYAGFGSWEQFTENCCCMERNPSNATNSTSDFPVELWACTNGNWQKGSVVYKERTRVRSGDAVRVRAFCGRHFVNSRGEYLEQQEPVWDEPSGKLVVSFVELGENESSTPYTDELGETVTPGDYRMVSEFW